MARHGSVVMPMAFLVLLLVGPALAQKGPPVELWNTFVSNLSKLDLILEICSNATVFPNCPTTTMLKVSPLSVNRIGQGYPTEPIGLRIKDVATGKMLVRKLWPGQLDPYKQIGSIISFVPIQAGYKKQLQVWLGNDKFGSTRLGNIIFCKP